MQNEMEKLSETIQWMNNENDSSVKEWIEL